MFLIKVLHLTLFVVPLYGLLSKDLKKTEAVDLNYDNNDNLLVDLPLTCDLTKNLCDINCCYDEDCNEAERASFDCTQEKGDEISLFGGRYCDSVSSQHLEARAILCLQHANSPYLGEFHIEDEPYSHNIIPNILQSRKKKVGTFSEQLDNDSNRISSDNYYYGSKILKYEGESKKSTISLPFNVLKQTGFCTEMPLKFMINTNANCLYTLSEETCSNNAVFNLSHFLPSELQVIHGGDRIIKIQPEIHCLRNGTEYISFFRNLFFFSGSSGQTISEKKKCANRDCYTRLNKNKGVCENVIVSLTYVFHRNQTSLLSGKMRILLADIPLSFDSFLQMKNGSHNFIEQIPDDVKPYMYLSQSFRVFFTDGIDIPSQIKRQGYKLNDVLHTNKNYSSLS